MIDGMHAIWYNRGLVDGRYAERVANDWPLEDE